MQSEWGLGNNDEQSAMDEIKDILLDTNPYFFGLTVIVYILHSLFEFLAIKNEV